MEYYKSKKDSYCQKEGILKIAVVSHAADTHSGSRAPIELAKAFAKKGHEVFFFAYKEISKTEAIKELKYAKIDVRLIKIPENKLLGKLLPSFALAKDLKRIKPNIISTQAKLPFILGAKLSGIPVAYTYMGTQLDIWLDRIFPSQPNYLDNIINIFLNWLIKLNTIIQLSTTSYIITFSKYCKNELDLLYHKKSSYVFWGSRTDLMAKTQANKTKSNSTIHLLSVSRIVPYKGFHTQIETVNELTPKFPIKLTIIGSYPDKKYLNYLKKIKNQNTQIIVNPSDQILSKYYQSTDIYITCDKFLFFGMPIFEAASFGKPTVAFDFASAKEVVKNHKTGIIVSTKEEFKKAIIKLANSKRERQKLGYNAQKFSKNYTWGSAANFYLKQFKKWQKH